MMFHADRPSTENALHAGRNMDQIRVTREKHEGQGPAVPMERFIQIL